MSNTSFDSSTCVHEWRLDYPKTRMKPGSQGM